MPNTSPFETAHRIRIGISSCLLGQSVRFDGGHKRNAFLSDVLSRYVEWVPVCPEVEMGLGVPRETLRLVDNGAGVRLTGKRSGTDHSETMRGWIQNRSEQLADLGLCGFVFKRSSPSCGVQHVKVYRQDHLLHTNGTGLFAKAIVDRFEELPVEDEGRLNDPRLCENFISSVFAYNRWRELESDGLTRAAVMRFHARHKYFLMAHDQILARRLGRLTTEAQAYFALFCRTIRRIPTRRNHTNVLQHMAGYFSDALSNSDRAEITEVIERYRLATLPLIVPMTLIRHYVRKHAVAYLEEQIYLDPHPIELRLLNQL